MLPTMTDLIGPELDAAVWRALKQDYPAPEGATYPHWWHPSTDWAHGGPIIQRERIALTSYVNGDWEALALSGSSIHYERNKRRGPTPLIAAMRAYVASKG